MSDKKEILLTIQEIKQIESFVLRNPQLADPNSLNIDNGKCSIAKVSPITGLILVWGNDFTGFSHIHERHDFFSITPYWVEMKEKDGTKKKLQDQSRFRPDTTPFWDYISIADSIYKPNNISVDKNSRPDEFDLYFGEYVNKENKSEMYKLLLYKNSKVIHSLYPQSKRNNKKRVSGFDFSRGVVRGLQNYNQGVLEITIPYLDHERVVRYSILIKKHLGPKIEEANIVIHNADGVSEGFVLVAERIFYNFRSLNHEIMMWQHTDLRYLENWIKKINDQLSRVA